MAESWDDEGRELASGALEDARQLMMDAERILRQVVSQARGVNVYPCRLRRDTAENMSRVAATLMVQQSAVLRSRQDIERKV